jgi:hypothetical protein
LLIGTTIRCDINVQGISFMAIGVKQLFSNIVVVSFIGGGFVWVFEEQTKATDEKD